MGETFQKMFARRRDLLRRIAKARTSKYEAVGSGNELRFKVGNLSGSALDVDGHLLHLVALRSHRRPSF